MDDRHYKRISSSVNLNTSNLLTVLRSHFTSGKFSDVPKAILAFFKGISIPATAVSSLFLFSGFAHAEPFTSRGDVRNGIFSREAIENRGGSLSEISQFVKDINSAIDWVRNIKEHIYQWSLDLLSFTYETLVNVVLHTPLMIFNNPYIKNTSLTFSMISVSIIVLLTVYEMIMKMLKKKHTDFPTILKRMPIAIGVAGFAPYLFQKAFEMINKITKGITKVGGVVLNGDTFANIVSVGEWDVLLLLLFDVTLLGLLIPILLQNGRRWFDLLCLAAVTPLALTAWMFDRYSHMFDQWWNSIKRKSVIQLVYATFIVLMGVFIYGTRFISPDLFLIKLLITIGSLHALYSPPQIVRSYSRGDGDLTTMYSDYKNSAKGIYNTITLKNLKPLQVIKKNKQNKLTQIQKLRKENGRRFVGDLLK
ncbi:hypothetical protein [Bacillus sp. UMB0728]|uniref:hypothetical protein n=1 Tax=Bacillus sp. UMB0728 TaxID=2066052 RepID=UPI000C786793|nr:hypothetical protein [Bacillus sp. UMB0728]PLR72288.1 hypothetical protein CYJ37_12080 [Bacillus sp. UMB0728]